MQKLKLLVLLFLAIPGFWLMNSQFDGTGTLLPETIEGCQDAKPQKVPKAQRVAAAFELEYEKTVDPTIGRVPRERLIQAYEEMRQIQARENRTAIAAMTWKELGPYNVAGRTRAILIDPNDPTGKRVFAASVAGGLWETNDIYAATPDWAPVNDFFNNLAITTIVADPSNPSTFYFGTGEGYGNADAVVGLGIWKSTDAGASWTQLPSTNAVYEFYFISRLAVTGNGTLIATTKMGGVQRSTDGGSSWTKVLGAGMGISGASSDVAFDVEVAGNGDVYATLDGSIHKSTDDGQTFGSALPIPVTADRIELATAPSDTNFVYALVERNGQVEAILITTNGGASWVVKNEPADLDPGVPATDFARGQAWYNLTLAVDPNDEKRLYIGGIDLFVTSDGANTWNQITHWYGGFGKPDVHADQHFILFKPGSSDTLYFGNDGGIFQTLSGSNNSPEFISKNIGYNVTQFYACDLHPEAYKTWYLAGAQDNGTQLFRDKEPGHTRSVTGGDGAFCHIDQDDPDFQYTQYVYNNYYRSTDGGRSFTAISVNNNGRFINPTDFDDANDILYAANGVNNYLRWDNAHSGASFTSVPVTPFGGIPSVVKVSPNVNNTVYFGFGNGKLFRVDNAHATPTSTEIGIGLPNRYMSSIAIENGNENHLLITYSNYGVNSVWETTDAGSTWTGIEGNLPDMPVRWAIFDPVNPNRALLATELGVWTTESLNGASTTWSPSNVGLANVRTDMLRYRPSDKLLVVATHGRGLYQTDFFTNTKAKFTSTKHVTYTGKEISFRDFSYKANSWDWDFGDGKTHSSDQNPVHVYDTPGIYSVILSINGGASSDTLFDYVHVLPDLGTPYATTDGGGFDVNPLHFAPENLFGTGWELGASAVTGKQGTFGGSNAWVTGINESTYYDNSHANLYSPSFNFTTPGTYTLGFRARFETESDYDGFRVEYSLDKGSTWTLLGGMDNNWYNFENSTENTSFCINQPYFSGSRGNNFRAYSVDVSSLAGNSDVAFRLVFKSDLAVSSAGIAIDNFEVDGPPNTSNPFPVEWSPLAGNWYETGVELKWRTFMENNNSGFEVLRSADGDSFEQIAFVTGKGNSHHTVNYEFIDRDLHQSFYYYRLRQLDYDGKSSLSNVVKVQNSTPDPIAIHSVYPVPAASFTTIRFSDRVEGDISVELIDVEGNVLQREENEAFTGTEYEIRLNERIAPGILILRVRLDDEIFLRKITRI